MNFFLLTLSLFLSLSAAAPPAFAPKNHTFQVKESIPSPHGFSQLGRAPPESTIRLRIALFQQDFAGLESALYEISDPDHPRYGAHLSKTQVEQYVAPHPETLSMVDEWLASHGIHESDLARSPAKDWVSVTLPIHRAEELLGTEYYVWQHTDGDTLVRTTRYSLPQYLHSHIELIQPTTMFTRGNAMSSPSIVSPDGPVSESHAVDDFDCNTRVTLACLMRLYNAAGYKPRATKKNAIGITSFLGQYANVQNLQTFYRQELPAAVNSSFKFVSVYGGLNNQSLSAAGQEANLDVQFGLGISYPTPGTFWSTPGSPPFFPDGTTVINTNEPYLDWLDYILNSEHIPATISTSYGDDEQTVPFTYASRVCKRFAELGSRGVTLLMASGDGGVGPGACLTNDGSNQTRFIAQFPSTCPYVTSVGGTTSIPEVSAGFSGGGFSDYFSRPEYQDKKVGHFLEGLGHKTYDGLYNRQGRGIPDVSAQSDRFTVYWRDYMILMGGTSAATPTFAGILALLNDARLAAHRPALGFLNPLLYKHGEGALNDITVGNNPGCGTPGFNATHGWDPVTGLGTPDFRALLKVCV
ncbi:tripeptidyl peptidase A [Roridomyces roridus]|uniref:tripeptidyl-peptidase II n=1 Tax=Roridomyces roridus TaxID=1738132 RepID=A0AAD7C7A8_9AGAR|nr:tripeptidyl peptidase A [Roridomyces roridus]